MTPTISEWCHSWAEPRHQKSFCSICRSNLHSYDVTRFTYDNQSNLLQLDFLSLHKLNLTTSQGGVPPFPAPPFHFDKHHSLKIRKNVNKRKIIHTTFFHSCWECIESFTLLNTFHVLCGCQTKHTFSALLSKVKMGFCFQLRRKQQTWNKKRRKLEPGTLNIDPTTILASVFWRIHKHA